MSGVTASASTTSGEESRLPGVSILMPVRNEAAFIARSLGAVLAQDYPRIEEVLVIDGLSDDDTPRIVGALSEEYPQVHLIQNAARLQAAALNVGAARARGDVLVRVDGRALLEPDYVTRCVRLLAETGAVSVGGRQVPVVEGWQAGAIAAAMTTPFGVGPAQFRFGERTEEVDTVYLGAWPRADFERVGGFNETLVANEDYEFNYRLRQAGGTIFFSPDIRVSYYGRPTLGGLWRQYFNYGFWKARVIALHPRSMRLRQLIAPLFVVGLIVGGALSLSGGLWRFIYVAAVVVYGLLVMFFSVLQAARHGWRCLPLLPIIFLSLHLSWGTGFWVGVGCWWIGCAGKRT